jgi:hypothetical protein
MTALLAMYVISGFRLNEGNDFLDFFASTFITDPNKSSECSTRVNSDAKPSVNRKPSRSVDTTGKPAAKY